MSIRLDTVEIPVARQKLEGTVLSPTTQFPGVLFVHGWGGKQEHDLSRAREVAGLGAVCLTFDLRGHERNAGQWETVNREENLADLCAAYDWLAAEPNVDPGAIAVVGISYGGYLASILTTHRDVRWLALRSPALYPDEGWELPKRKLHEQNDLDAYRRSRIHWRDNRALAAAAGFRGDALVVEACNDEIIPHQVIENFVAAFQQPRSLTARRLTGADHALTEKSFQSDYNAVLVKWLTEMIVGARAGDAASEVERHKQATSGHESARH